MTPDPAVTVAELDVPALQRRTVRLLSVAQVLAGVGVAAGITAGSLLVLEVTGEETWSGLAQTSNVLGTAVAAVPLARLSSVRGRRAGLATGLLVAAAGAGVVVLGAVAESLALLLVGCLLVGAASAATMQARYAATDLAEPARVAGALSTVVWSATVGAVLGPNLLEPAAGLGEALGLPPLSGAYLVTGLALVASALLVATLMHPDPLLTARRLRGVHEAPPHVSVSAALRVVARSRTTTLALLAMVLGHAVMVMVMVMTPVHMKHVDVSLQVIGLVISVHILGMYVFSPVVGALTDRFSAQAVIVAGGVILLVSTVVSGTAAAHDSGRLGVGLFLLGLGWSCTMVAGSALLTSSVPDDDRPAVQGTGDTLMYAGAAVAGALAGVVVSQASYGWLNALAAMLLVPLAVAVVWERTGRQPVA